MHTETSNNKINQKLIIPLFNTIVDEPLRFEIASREFVEHLTFHMFPEPILLNKNTKQKSNNEAIPIVMPTPKTTIHLYPWKGKEQAKQENDNIIPLDQLPLGFDTFDNLGAIAFRSGPGDVFTFQTITHIATARQATALLIIEFRQEQPNALRWMPLPQNPYELNLAESILDAVRLVSGNEPHQHKGFHLNDDQLTDIVIKWPLARFQGEPVNLVKADLNKLKAVFLDIWQIRHHSRDSRSCRILTLALGYYYLSSTMTEFRTIFLYLIIAFEALFKRREEDSANKASARMATLLAETKAQYSEIQKFLWGTHRSPGCCRVRNNIVHGEGTSPPKEMFWQLRHYLRHAILRIGYLILSSQIDRNNYYESLTEYINSRFAGLPNK